MGVHERRLILRTKGIRLCQAQVWGFRVRKSSPPSQQLQIFYIPIKDRPSILLCEVISRYAFEERFTSEIGSEGNSFLQVGTIKIATTKI
jgi:hypothetical protein